MIGYIIGGALCVPAGILLMMAIRRYLNGDWGWD